MAPINRTLHTHTRAHIAYIALEYQTRMCECYTVNMLTSHRFAEFSPTANFGFKIYFVRNVRLHCEIHDKLGHTIKLSSPCGLPKFVNHIANSYMKLSLPRKFMCLLVAAVNTRNDGICIPYTYTVSVLVTAILHCVFCVRL